MPRRAAELHEVDQICSEIQAVCWPGCPADVLKTTLAGMRALKTTLQVLEQRESAASTLQPHTMVQQLSESDLAKMSDN